MAVTETTVHDAADQICLVDGQRPTTERIRAVLGGGSPNTVGPYLDSWFKLLGARLGNATSVDTAMPGIEDGVPRAAREAFRQMWAVATTEARAAFTERLDKATSDAAAGVAAAMQRAEHAETSRQAEAVAFRVQIADLQLQVEERAAAHDQAMQVQLRERGAVDAQLVHAKSEIALLSDRCTSLEAMIANVRQEADRAVSIAVERSDAAQRRASLEIEEARSGRKAAESRCEGLERRLEALQAARQASDAALASASSEVAKATELLAGARAESERLAAAAAELGKRCATETEIARRAVDERDAARRERDAEKGAAEMARSLLEGFRDREVPYFASLRMVCAAAMTPSTSPKSLSKVAEAIEAIASELGSRQRASLRELLSTA